LRYLLLVYAAGGVTASAAPGEVLVSHELEPAWTATSVRVRAGETVLGDGPAAGVEAALARVDVLAAATLDEAIAVAERIPEAREGVVEIRPLAGEAAA
jgi:hypothetical protein